MYYRHGHQRPVSNVMFQPSYHLHTTAVTSYLKTAALPPRIPICLPAKSSMRQLVSVTYSMEGTSNWSRDKSVYKFNHPEGDTRQVRTLLLDEEWCMTFCYSQVFRDVAPWWLVNNNRCFGATYSESLMTRFASKTCRPSFSNHNCFTL